MHCHPERALARRTYAVGSATDAGGAKARKHRSRCRGHSGGGRGSGFLLRGKACKIPRMKTSTALLLVVIAVLSFQVFRQRELIHEQRDRITEIQAQVSATVKVAAVPLEYQEKCAEQARRAFHDLGYKSQGPAGYENHYNAKLNKCFVLVENT